MAQQGKPIEILYVEDDRDLAMLVKERLSQAGFAVDVACDGEEALRKHAQRAYDLLALDQTLPGLDGLSVLRAIAARGPLPPTVMVTGTGNERLAVQTMKLGADDYVIKDFDGAWLDLLPAIVQRVLGHRRLADEKRAAETALHEKEEQLWRAQKLESLGILAGGIAHDFNNILAGIMGYADLARLKLPPSHPAREDLDVIKKAVHRAADLTRQMLAYAGKGKFVVEPINLSQIVEESRKIMGISVSKKTLLKFNLATQLPSIQADASQVQQVILNLVINASEALGEASGAIAISTDTVHLSADDASAMSADCDLREGPYVRLEVADTGCGMDQETLAKIFDPFFTTKFTGRGLGLAAVHGIVRGHQGGIEVISQPGKGTTFRIYFPAVDAPPSAAPGESPPDAWRGHGTVLIADDEELLRNLAARMVQSAGFSPLTARDGEEAIRLFRSHQPEIACVLLDLTMPKMDGVETFDELRRISPQVRVILMSGYGEEVATQRFANSGLAGFLKKPFGLDAVVDTLKKAIGAATR